MPQLGVKLTVSGAQRGSKGCAWSSCAGQALPELGASSEQPLTGQCDGAVFKRNLCLSCMSL